MITENLSEKIYSLVHDLGRKLTSESLTIATAESCTGGMLAQFITSQPGASKYYLGSIVAYDNKIKELVLGLSKTILQSYGAVSEQTATAMSNNIRVICSSNIGIGITGIAGPDGAMKGKPVGLVYVALNTKKENICKKFIFDGNRDAIRLHTVYAALSLIDAYLWGRN